MTKAQRQARLRKIWGKRSPRDLAEELGVSLRTIRRDASEMDLPAYKPRTVAKNVADLRRTQDLRDERKQKRALAKRVMQQERELEAANVVGSHKGFFEITHTKSAAPTRAVAIAVISDLHIEENVDPHTVNGLNEFNEEICKERMRRLFCHLVKLVHMNQQATEIDTLVMFVLGDLISSNIHDELLETCRLPPIDAALEAMDYLAGGIQYILDNTDVELIIPCKVGNHSRITKRVHISTEAGNSLEWFIYNSLAKQFAGEQRVKFVLERSMESYIDVWPDFRIRYMHGHSMKGGGGVGGVMVPILRAVGKMDGVIRADLTVLGHFHNYKNFGNVIVNGSGIGWAPFASFIHATFELPKMAFALVDERLGVTVATPIVLTEDR
jgi:hypothetical protein